MAFQIVKIPDLPVASAVQATDQFPIETADGTKRVTQSVIDTYSATKFLRKNVNESTTGTITAAGFTVSSSEKFKEKIAPLSFDDVARVLALVPVSYVYKSDSPVKPGQADIGLIAEQVLETVPELVVKDESGNLSVDYSKLSVFLLLVLKNLTAGK
jgi:hypothetical protein